MGLFPSSIEQQAPAAANPAGPGLAERWRGWMSKPENAAMLMQSGIAMLQPLQLGQSTAGAIASSVGEGFQARDRVRAGNAAASEKATRIAMDQRELDLREKEGSAKADYYKRLGGGGAVSASAIFRDQQSDQARKDKAWMEFRADEAWKNTNATIDEMYEMFEEAWSKTQGGEPAASAALPGLETPQSPLEEARAAIAAGANREAVIQRLKENGIDAAGL